MASTFWNPQSRISAAELEAVSQLLEMLNHRNKNQHRRNGWWKWQSMLRRYVGKLLQEIDRNDENGVKTRVAWMDKVLFPKCYFSFTQLVADSQFSRLGLVLVAELARTQKAVGAFAARANSDAFHESARLEHGKYGPNSTLEDVGEALARPLERNDLQYSFTSLSSTLPDQPIVTGRRDERRRGKIAQAITLEMPDGAGSVDAVPTRLGDVQSAKSTLTETARKKQKRRKVNPIDDLFEGLT